MLAKVLPSSLGEITEFAFHPSIGSCGAVFVETNQARITLSLAARATEAVRRGCTVMHWDLFDLCWILDPSNKTAVVAPVLRQVMKADDALRDAQLAHPVECQVARTEVKSWRAMLRATTVLLLLAPFVLGGLLKAPIDTVVFFSAIHAAFALVSLAVYRRWQCVFAQLFCDPMIGVEYKRVGGA